MELGGGCVNLSKEFPLKGREGETHPDAFKYRLVHEEERIPLSRSVIHTHRFPRSARTNGDVRVMSAAEGIKVIQVGIPTVILQVLKGCQAGALVQKLVGGPGIESFMILPVDQNVGALPRQTWIDVCAAFASVLHRDPPQEPAKEQSGAAAADRTPTPKSVTEPPITKSNTQELSRNREPVLSLSIL